MNALDIVLSLIIIAIIALAVRSIIKRKGNCCNCSGDCSCCNHKNQKD